jgi:hypothetical protein
MSDLGKLAKYGIYLGLILYIIGMLLTILHLPFVAETQTLAIVIVTIFYCFNFIVLEDKGWTDYLGLLSITILLLKLFPDQVSIYAYTLIEKFYHPSFIFLFFVVFINKVIDTNGKVDFDKYKFGSNEEDEPKVAFKVAPSKNYLSNFQYGFGAIAIIGLLFKMMYWDYASILIVVGFLGYASLMLIGGFLKK